MLSERRSVVFHPSELNPSNRLSRWFLGTSLVHSCLLIILMSMSCSVAYTMIALHLADIPITWPAYVVALITPAVIALALTSVILRLMREHEQTRNILLKTHQYDSLTGVYNRHHFMGIAEREFELARRKCTALSLLIMDVDYFRQVNDTYGYQCGEMVLREIIGVCKDVLRSSDVLARYGGDEFIVLLPLTVRDGANAISARLCKKMAEHGMLWKDRSVQITFSVGVVEYQADTTNLSTLIAAAERALYCAKAAGGNQVCSVVANSKEESLKRL